jgi:hypothetical protein
LKSILEFGELLAGLARGTPVAEYIAVEILNAAIMLYSLLLSSNALYKYAQ